MSVPAKINRKLVMKLCSVGEVYEAMEDQMYQRCILSLVFHIVVTVAEYVCDYVFAIMDLSACCYA